MSDKSRSTRKNPQSASAKPKAQRRLSIPRPKGKSIRDYIRWAHKVCDLVVREYISRSNKPNEKKRSAHDLHVIINEYYQDNGGGEIVVEILEKDEAFATDLFLGFVVRRDKSGPIIYLNPYQTNPGMRLAVIQESFQALLDHKDLRSKSLGAAIDDYIVFRRDRKFDKAKGPTYGELIAEIVAMEALFPYEDRMKIVKLAKASPLTEKIIRAVAKEYCIPAKWIRFYLRKEIMDQLRQFHPNKKRRLRPSKKRRR